MRDFLAELWSRRIVVWCLGDEFMVCPDYKSFYDEDSVEGWSEVKCYAADCELLFDRVAVFNLRVNHDSS